MTEGGRWIDWISLAQNRNKWSARVNVVINVWVP
jgi:hypothetical protein